MATGSPLSRVQIYLTVLPAGKRVLLHSASKPDMKVIGQALRWLKLGQRPPDCRRQEVDERRAELEAEPSLRAIKHEHDEAAGEKRPACSIEELGNGAAEHYLDGSSPKRTITMARS